MFPDAFFLSCLRYKLDCENIIVDLCLKTFGFVHNYDKFCSQVYRAESLFAYTVDSTACHWRMWEIIQIERYIKITVISEIMTLRQAATAAAY